MLTLSKGIEPGDWLSFWGTLFGALIGAVIAGGIAIYVAHRQNKQQNDYIEKQNELDKRVKEYELIYELVSRLIDNAEKIYEEITRAYVNYIYSNEEIDKIRYLSELEGKISTLNNSITSVYKTIENNLHQYNRNITSIDFNNLQNELKNTYKFMANNTNVSEELHQYINKIAIAKSIFSENLYKSLSEQLKHTYK